MPAEILDAVVVGAGPAGSAAALALARAGRSVVLLERGPFPGSKNVYGGVVYGRVLDEVIPRWWEQVPVQRWVVRRGTMVLTGSQALSVDYRTQAWGEPPYNGMTTFRSDFDSWLADHAVAAGADLITSTVATGLLRGPGGEVTGVRTDRPDGDIRARAVIAADGVNSFLAKEAGLLPASAAAEHTLGVKEVLGLPASVIEDRFAVGPGEGADFEMIGVTRGIPGGGFLYTGTDTVSVGVVVSLPGLAAAAVRPEELVADVKAHPAIAPYLRGATVREYSAHLIPEGGYRAMPKLAIDGMIIAGDAAGMCLAAGLWLEGVNFAIGSGLAAGRAVARAVGAGDTSARGLAGYRRELESAFVLADHKRLRGAPRLVLSERVQQRYPGMVCDLAEGVFTVTNPVPKPGLARLARRSAKRHGVRLSGLLRDTLRRAGVPVTAVGDRGGGWPETSFAELIGTVEFRVGQRAHITVDSGVCRSCTTKACVTACPANLFAPTADGGILFSYEQCFECGTCYQVCNSEGAITWTYPDGGYGVVFPERLTMAAGDSAAGSAQAVAPGPAVAPVPAPGAGPLVVVCLRHAAARPDVDLLTGTVRPPVHGAGPAPAELAALELGLRFAAAWRGEVLAVTGGPPAAEATLRDALAAGAAEVLRVDWPEADYLDGLAADEQALAAALAGALRPGRPALVLCGDRSADRGTGALPAFLAHELGAAQALGLVSLALPGDASGPAAAEAGPAQEAEGLGLVGERRLPGGWRERLWIGLPAVCSVEAAGVSLRRAPLDAMLASRRAAIPVARPQAGPGTPVIAGPPRPYRPRTHEVPSAPAGSARERLAELSGVLVQIDPPALLGPASPAEAARALLDFLQKPGATQGVP